MDRLVDELEKSGKDSDRARLAVTLMTSAVAPTNFGASGFFVGLVWV